MYCKSNCFHLLNIDLTLQWVVVSEGSPSDILVLNPLGFYRLKPFADKIGKFITVWTVELKCRTEISQDVQHVQYYGVLASLCSPKMQTRTLRRQAAPYTFEFCCPQLIKARRRKGLLDYL